MSRLLLVPVRARAFRFLLALGGALVIAQPAFAAGPAKPVIATARGQVISKAICSPTEVCQEAVVQGQATQLGSFVGFLAERVDITNGTYTGTATFTTTLGDSVSTEYTGNVTPPDPQGRVIFVEHHVVVSGTGRFASATGNLDVLGTANATGQILIVGVGSLAR